METIQDKIPPGPISDPQEIAALTALLEDSRTSMEREIGRRIGHDGRVAYYDQRGTLRRAMPIDVKDILARGGGTLDPPQRGEPQRAPRTITQIRKDAGGA